MSAQAPADGPGEPVALRYRPIPIDTTPYAAYTGSSMNPTLREPELMEVVPYGERAVRRGDVILFRSPNGGGPVVHRVTSVNPDGIRTRGDNNSREDAYTLQQAHITGRVVAAWRGGRRRVIPGGRLGELHQYAGRWRVALDRGLSPLIHPIYHALARCGVLHALVPLHLKPRVVTFQTKQGRRIRILIGQRVVGRFDSERQRWHIDRPFRLWVDESKLPRPQ